MSGGKLHGGKGNQGYTEGDMTAAEIIRILKDLRMAGAKTKAKEEAAYNADIAARRLSGRAPRAMWSTKGRKG